MGDSTQTGNKRPPRPGVKNHKVRKFKIFALPIRISVLTREHTGRKEEQ